LNVKGKIENINDNDIYNYSYDGAVTAYLIYLETTNNIYQISYIDKELIIDNAGVEGDFTVIHDKLIITFDLLDEMETFVSLYGYSMAIDFSNLKYPIHIDIAPNEALFIPSIDAPSTAFVGEEIEFYSEVIDFLGIGFSLADDPYLWDFDDGTTSTEQNPTHTYNQNGNFTVRLSVTSSYGVTSNATHEINIYKSENKNIFDVNTYFHIDIQDVFFIWNHRKDTPKNSFFDVNCDKNINFKDIWLVWKNIDRYTL